MKADLPSAVTRACVSAFALSRNQRSRQLRASCTAESEETVRAGVEGSVSEGAACWAQEMALDLALVCAIQATGAPATAEAAKEDEGDELARRLAQLKAP
eukprot:1330912-Rhodomonas_salina.3